MPMVFTSDEADDAGRRPITLIHHQPEQLPPGQRDRGVEVPAAALDPPEHEPHERVLPWLTEAGDVQWDVSERPDDDPAQVARRLGAVERAIGRPAGPGGPTGPGQGATVAERVTALEQRVAALEGGQA